MTLRTLPRGLFLGGLLFGLALSAGVAAAHVGADDEETHVHEPTPEQIDKRLQRVIKRTEERQQNRQERSRDRKRALAKRLARRLNGAPLSDEAVAELRRHAERVAKLRRIRYLGAVDKSYEIVAKVDKLLAKENARHERWWRTSLRGGDKP